MSGTLKPIRLLLLIPNLRTGGAQQFTVTLLSELKRSEGMTPAITVLDAPGHLEGVLEGQGISIRRFQKPAGLPSPRWLLAVARHLNDGAFDVLQMHGASAALWGCLLTAANPNVIRIVAYHTIHGWRKARKRWFTNRIPRPLVHRYVAVCDAESRSLAAAYGIDPRKIEIIPNCVDSSRYRPAPPNPDIKRQLRLPDNLPLAGVVGRHSVEKGGDVFIRAMALLKAKSVPVHGALIGDGPASPAWRNLADALGVNDVVTFTGRIPQDHMPDVIRSLDIGVVPSYQECCSVAILEQMACGLPVVATDVGGNAELVVHGATGMVVPPDNPPELAAAIEQILRTPEDRRRYGRNARGKIEARFTIGAVTSRYTSLYRSLFIPSDSNPMSSRRKPPAEEHHP